MIQDVKFQGMSNSPSDHNSTDGELGTCLNLIPEDDELKPIAQPVVVENFKLSEGEDIVYVHKVTHNEELHSHYIIHSTTDNKWYWIEKDSTDGVKNEILNIPNDFTVNSISSIGNILCFVGKMSIRYALWKEGKYMAFSREDLMYSINITSEYINEYFVAEMGGDFWNLFHTEKEGSISELTAVGTQKAFAALDAIVNKYINESGKSLLKYIVFGVAAVRLYDGAYYNISTPFILAPNTWSVYKGAKAPTGTMYPTLSESDFALVYNADSEDGRSQFVKTSFSLHSHNITINFDGNNALDLIQGVDIFLTKGDLFFKTDKVYEAIAHAVINGKNRNGYCHISMLSEKETYNTIDNLSFYHSIFIPKGDFGKSRELKNVLGTEESISLANLNRFDFGGNCAINYNNRLHVANINNGSFKTFEFYPTYTFLLENSSKKDIASDDRLYIDVYPDLPLEDGQYKKDSDKGIIADVVAVVYGNKKYYISGKIQYPLQPIIVFPIENAYRAELYVNINNKFYYYDLTLHPSETMAISYHVVHGFRLIQRKGISYELSKLGEENEYMGNWKLRVLYDSSKENSSKQDWDKSYDEYTKEFYSAKQPSLIRVSEAENPLVFPAANSVQVGSSVIQALAANTRPITEGQFGDAPLYVFTDEGTWMLMLSAEGTYLARQPVNRDVCSNPKGILQIDNAVLFPTERGIMMQEGSSSKLITDVLDGTVFDFMQLYKEDYSKRLLAVGNIPEADVRYIPFRQFMKNADMVYDYYDNRIIVFNPDCSYAYVYSLKSGMWGTMHSDIKKRVNIYPEAYAVNKDMLIVDMHQSQPTEDVKYFLCTRPLSLSSGDVYKTMFSCITRGYFRNELGKCGMALYGSNDLFHWVPISTSVNKYLRGMCGSPYKYFRLALIGSLSPEERLSGVSTDFQERWQNKLR